MAQEFSLQRVLATEERSGFLRSREHVRAEGKRTSQGMPSAVCYAQALDTEPIKVLKIVYFL